MSEVDEAAYKDISFKIKNILRFLKNKFVLDETNVASFKELLNRAMSLKSNEALSNKYQLEQLLMRAQPALQQRELTPSLSNIGGEEMPCSSSIPSEQIREGEKIHSTSSVGEDESGHESSQRSQSDNLGQLQKFKEFCRTSESKLLDIMHINKNLISDINSADTMYLIGSSQPRDKKRIFFCGYMKFNTQQVIDFAKYAKDFSNLLFAQRFPVAVARVMNQGEQIDSNFLHSIVNIDCALNLGLIKQNNKLLMFRLTQSGYTKIKNCNEKGPHSHGWTRQSTQFLKFYKEEEVNKLIVEQKQMHTKFLKRSTELNNVVRVSNAVQVSPKIEPRNHNYKFAEKFYYNITKYSKFAYLVLIPNAQNLLATLDKFQNLGSLEQKYKDQHVVITCRTNKVVPAAFNKMLFNMKSAIGCIISVKVKGTFLLVYKIGNIESADKIEDVNCDDIDQGKMAGIYDKILTYSQTNAKDYETKQATISEVSFG